MAQVPTQSPVIPESALKAKLLERQLTISLSHAKAQDALIAEGIEEVIALETQLAQAHLDLAHLRQARRADQQAVIRVCELLEHGYIALAIETLQHIGR